MKKKISIILSFLLMVIFMLPIASCDVIKDIFGGATKEASVIKVENAPTILSGYGEDLKISTDGTLLVRFVDNEVSKISITMDMLDLSRFDKNSMEPQTLIITYGGKKTTLVIQLIRDVRNMYISQVPTLTTNYTEVPLEINDDGILNVEYSDGEVETITITQEMLDLSNFDVNSTEEQNIPVLYSGSTTYFSVTREFEEINTRGETKVWRFEAEYGELGGSAATEENGGMLRADGSVDMCVRNMWLGADGGFINFYIVCDKKTEATINIAIGKNGFNHAFDDYACLQVNGEKIPTGIVPGENCSEEYGVPAWWVFRDYTVQTKITLKRGLNVISIRTYWEAGILMDPNVEAMQNSIAAGGRNIGYIDIVTTGTLAWQKEE